MENIFFKIDDYRFYSNIRNFLNSNIESLDDYIAWVYQWKAYEKELVAAIRESRTNARKFIRKYSGERTNISAVNSLMTQKRNLRKLANLFYKKRTENKEFYKKMKFGDINKSIIKETENA